MRALPPPSRMTRFSPSMTVSRVGGTSIVREIAIVAGAGPQLNLTTPLDWTAARRASSVQLAALPSPTVAAMPDVSAAATAGTHTPAPPVTGGAASAEDTSHPLTTPNSGSAPKNSLLHSPPPETVLVIQLVPPP